MTTWGAVSVSRSDGTRIIRSDTSIDPQGSGQSWVGRKKREHEGKGMVGNGREGKGGGRKDRLLRVHVEGRRGGPVG